MERASSQTDSPVPTDASVAAQAMVARFVDSWNKADGAAYGENYWPDAELVDPSGWLVAAKLRLCRSTSSCGLESLRGANLRAGFGACGCWEPLL